MIDDAHTSEATGAATPAGGGRPRPQLLLLAIPFAWQVGGVPFVNDVAASPLGLPFPLLWQLVGVVIASAVIALVRAIDHRHERAAEDGADGA